MFRDRFVLLAALFILLTGMVAAYSNLGGGWCGCTSCADCTSALNDNTLCSKGVQANGSLFISPTSCIILPQNLSNGKIFDLNGTILQGQGGGAPDVGIQLWNNTNLTIANGSIQDFRYSGIVLQNVTYADVHNVTINGTFGAPGAGIFLGVNAPASAYNSYSKIYNCTILDNHNVLSAGIWISYADNNEIWDVVSSRNAHGFWIYGSQDNYVHDSVADSSTGAVGAGVYCFSLVDRASMRNVFERINASSNPYAGVVMTACEDSTINHSRLLSNNVGIAIDRGGVGYLTPHEITVHDNLISLNTATGIWVWDSVSTKDSASTFYNNTISGSIYGIYLNRTNNNTFQDNQISTNIVGFLAENATNTSVSGGFIRASTSVALWFMGSDDSSAAGVHFFNNNLLDFLADADGVAQDIQFTNVIFDRPAADYTDFTNLSLTDSMSGTQMYSITWTANAVPLPGDTASFANKWVNISNQSAAAVSIDQLIWNWQDSELPGYIESTFELWKYSGATWSNTGATLNAAANTLTINNLNPASDYGILQNLSKCPVITSAGAYQLQADLTGAPNAVSGPALLNAACIIIESDDVYIDCNGHTVTNDGTASATALLVNGSALGTYENITIENCPSMQDYRYGAYLYYMENSLVQNSSFYNNGERGLYLYFVEDSLVYNCSFYDNVYGINLRNSNNNNITESRAYGNSDTGVYFYASDNNLLNGSIARNTSGYGIDIFMSDSNEVSFTEVYGNDNDGIRVATTSFNNNISNCPIHDNGHDGVNVGSGCTGTIVEFSTLANNTNYGLNANACNNLYANRLHIYNNTQGGLYADATGAFSWIGDSLIFDNPLGNMQNYTNLSIVDALGAIERYTISWTTNSTALPGQAISFEQKFVDIFSGGAPSIDEIVWYWTAAEEAGYTPAQFKLVEYDGADWNLLNDTPNTGARTLSYYGLNPSSDYGILQYVENVSVLKIDQTAFQASPGGIVEFNITINNTGNITLDTVQVIDELPAGLTFDNAAPSPDVSASPVYTWNNVGPLAPGAATTILLNATVDAGVVFPGNEIVNLSNYVNITGTSSFGEILFAESEANATVYYANVSAVKTDITALPPSPGGMVTYQIDITNTGNVTLNPISVVDTLPAEFTYNATDTVPVTVTGGTVVNWTVGPLAPGVTVTILMDATVNSGTANGTYTNTVDVEAQPPNGDNVTSTDTVDVGVYAPAISVVKTASSYSPTVGQKVTFNLTITNTGESNLTIWANDTLPAQLVYVVGEADPLPTGTAGQVLYWDAIFVDILPGATVNIVYNVSVIFSGSAQNNVTVVGVPPNGDNVTDATSVTLAAKKPSSGGGDDKPLDIYVDEPVCLGEEVTVTVKTGTNTVSGAEVRIKTYLPSSTYWYYPDPPMTGSDGEVSFTPIYLGTHYLYADKESGYDQGQKTIEVIECEAPEVECYTNDDCPECYRCILGAAEAYNRCVLQESAQCGVNDKCPPAVECQETDDVPCPDPDSIPICIDCMCDWVECVTDEDCPAGEECIDYECTGGEEPPEEGTCETNSDCAYDEYCSGGQCLDLNCVCGYVDPLQPHICIFYECCSDPVCQRMYGENYTCNLDEHLCEESTEVVPGDQPIDVDVPDETSTGETVIITVTSDGNSVPGAEVTIVINNVPYSIGVTDYDGQIAFTPEEPGQYTVLVSKEGFASGEEQFQASEETSLWETIIRGVWILLFLLILLAIIYVLATRKKKRRPKEDTEE